MTTSSPSRRQRASVMRCGGVVPASSRQPSCPAAAITTSVWIWWKMVGFGTRRWWARFAERLCSMCRLLDWSPQFTWLSITASGCHYLVVHQLIILSPNCICETWRHVFPVLPLSFFPFLLLSSLLPPYLFRFSEAQVMSNIVSERFYGE